MQKQLILAMVLLPFLRAGAAPEQTPSYDPSTEAYGFPSDEQGGSSYLGVDTRDITPDRISALKLKDESGVEVTLVDQDAPAGKAGIKEHDVILTLNGNKVESVEQLRRMIREVPPGRLINLGLSRNGQPVNLQVQLADRNKSLAKGGRLPKSFTVQIPPMPLMPAIPAVPAIPDFDIPVSVVVVHSSMRSGLMVENLTSQLGEYFGTKNGHGVLVRSVEKGSHAERAGFRAGDVIVRVEKEPVHDSSDFGHALRSHSGGSVTVGIIRDKKEQTLTLTLPERRQSGDLFDEESFEFPDIDMQASLDGINARMANLKPQLAFAARRMAQASEQLKKKMLEEQKEMKKQQQEKRKQQLELRKQLREQQYELRNEMNQEQRELRRELQILQHGSSEI
jgi:serine protease Do